MGLEEQIIKIVEKYFELADRNDCFVVELVMKTKKLEIYIDSDDAIDFGICRKVSRVVEEFLDEGKQMGEDYTLEVSSPGLSRPLRLPRQLKLGFLPKHRANPMAELSLLPSGIMTYEQKLKMILKMINLMQ